MNLDYDRIKATKEKSEGGGNQWAAYSDLFMSMSVIFLLLYVMSSLRATSESVAKQSLVDTAEKKSQELADQVKAYEVVKDSYLKEQASKNEEEIYR
ncbi:MAG: flagellar motor protein MotB, partial [Pseudomonadota bacterium]